MEELNRQLADYLVESGKLCSEADHLIYVTYPVVKDKAILLKALEILHRSSVKIISFILKREYLLKKIKLTHEPEKNLRIFFEKCAGSCSLSASDIENLRELMKLAGKHRKSTIEFASQKGAVMLGEDGKSAELSVDSLKSFIKILKKLIENAPKF